MDMHFDGVIFHTHAGELARRMEYPYPPFAVVDVRSQTAFDHGHIPGSVLVDVGGSAHGGPALPPGTDESTEFFIVGAGSDDGMVRLGSNLLRQLGARRVVEVTGGLHEWRQLGLPLEQRERSAA